MPRGLYWIANGGNQVAIPDQGFSGDSDTAFPGFSGANRLPYVIWQFGVEFKMK